MGVHRGTVGSTARPRISLSVFACVLFLAVAHGAGAQPGAGEVEGQ